MNNERLRQQLDFILEIDRLKNVVRRNYLADGSRRENSAEHSWHLAVMALLLAEYASEPVDIAKVARMVLVHDIVEIDAGDTYAYDEAAAQDKEAREERAARRLFNLLPQDQAEAFMQLWREFEAMETPEARFAATLDRLMPLLHNYHSKGKSWAEHDISSDQVRRRNAAGRPGSEMLWTYAESLIQHAEDEGLLRRR